MAQTLHFHDHLDVFVDGRKVTVPANVGINVAADYLTSIHTHDATGIIHIESPTPRTGIIHIESPTPRTFTLGEFFDVWGVRFTASCLGGYCRSSDRALSVFVNGKRFNDDSGTLRLVPH